MVCALQIFCLSFAPNAKLIKFHDLKIVFIFYNSFFFMFTITQNKMLNIITAYFYVKRIVQKEN